MDMKAFLNHFNRMLICDFRKILIDLDSKGHWSNGVDNINLAWTDDKKGIGSVLVDMLNYWDKGNFVEHRFSVPKFLDILEKQKKDYMQLHPEETEAVEAEFEKFQKNLLQKWISA